MGLGTGFGGALGGGGYTPHPYAPAPKPAIAPQPANPFAQSFNDYTNFQQAYYAPTFAGLDQQNAAASGRLGAIQSATGASNSASRAQADIRAKQLDNMIAGNQIDINAIPRQIGYNDAVYGVNGQQYNSTDAMLAQLMGMTQAEYENATSRNNLQYRTDRRNWGNDVAARGSVSAPETQLHYNDLESQKWLADNSASIQRTTSQAQLTDRRNQALYDYTLQGLSTKEQNAKLKDRGDQLNLQAANYKLDKEALLAGINAQLAANNLQGILTAGQVLDGINSNNIQKAQLMNEIVYGGVQYAYGQGNTGASGGAPAASGGGLPRISTTAGAPAGGGSSW